jgi:hypothetical protein
MGQCASCGKENSILFDKDGQSLCWLCSSRVKAQTTAESPEAAEEAGVQEDERRAWQRFPVQIHAKVQYATEMSSAIIFPGTTVNISGGGMCIEWTPCDQCQGYIPGDIHQNCIFSSYNNSRENSNILYISLFLSEEDVINLTARAVFVMKKGGDKEYIGIAFINLDEYTQGRINEVIEKVTYDG